MGQDSLEVGVIVAKRRLKGPWADFAWLPRAVLPAAPAVAPWTRLSVDEVEEVYYAGAFTVALYPGETAHYRDNLTSGRPSLWVALRPTGPDAIEVAMVTADPYEGEALAEGVGEVVEPVPMPAEVRERIAAFFERFHVERPFVKRKRDRVDPDAVGRHAPRGGGREEEG